MGRGDLLEEDQVLTWADVGAVSQRPAAYGMRASKFDARAT